MLRRPKDVRDSRPGAGQGIPERPLHRVSTTTSGAEAHLRRPLLLM
ncbi:hypothetical protein B005_1467 [Nocardiopsis alba ATCC BAA-2165]|uniref:Uncharacterized protein n=1 Tax=Nocardiopsis alba (strain ATCC BAA-2165 / BE74) TaxID=1205910 RepID=J7LD84_NOCAA|nr:hypothetical protein B005_1467 [Nocardiopsis alba ATCC BAA-2165]